MLTHPITEGEFTFIPDTGYGVYRGEAEIIGYIRRTDSERVVGFVHADFSLELRAEDNPTTFTCWELYVLSRLAARAANAARTLPDHA